MPTELKAVSKSDVFDFTEAITFGADIRYRSVEDLVRQVTRMCPPRDLMDLCVIGHGDSGRINLGSDQLGGIAKVDPYTKLAPLRDILDTSDGILSLCVCEGGQNKPLLVEIARTINHPVYACEGDIRPCAGLLYRGMWCGRIIRAMPNGQWGVMNSLPDPASMRGLVGQPNR